MGEQRDAESDRAETYEHGIGVYRDRARAATYYRQACLARFKPACQHAR